MVITPERSPSSRRGGVAKQRQSFAVHRTITTVSTDLRDDYRAQADVEIM